MTTNTSKVLIDNQRLSTKGVIYVVYDATGTNKFYNECLYSIKTLKKHNPNLPITVFSDIDIKNDLIDNIVIIPRNKVSNTIFNRCIWFVINKIFKICAIRESRRNISRLQG